MKTRANIVNSAILMICLILSIRSPAQNHNDENSADTVVKDIPRDRRGRPDGIYLSKFEIENKLKLKSLENGFDSIQLRIWYGVALDYKLQLLILQKSNGKWSARFATIGLIYNKNNDSLASVTKEFESRSPRSGWRAVMDTLFNLGVLSLPDSRKISGYGEMQDGDGVTVEVATKKLYRMYNYSNFEEDKNIPEAQKIEKIMELLEREFSFKRLSS